MFAAAILLATLCPAAGAQASLDMLVSVQDDGSALVAERLHLPDRMAVPLRWRLPIASATPSGIKRRLFVDLLEVSDADGAHLAYQRKQTPAYLEVVVAPRPLAENTLRVAYKVRNAVRFGPEQDELAWPVENRWNLRIGELTASAGVPDRAAGSFSARLFSGGSALPPEINGRFATWNLSPPPQVAAMDVALPSGILHAPSPLIRLGWILAANPILLFPLLVLAAMLGLLRWAARQEDVAVAPRYEPPAGLSPIETGYLIDNRMDSRDVAATLLDLARRGYIRIEQGKPDEGVPYAGPDFVLHLLKPMGEWKGLAGYEDLMIFHTFYGGHWTKLSSLSLRFFSVVPMMARQVRLDLEEKGLLQDPHRAQALRLLAVIVLAGLMGIAQAAGWFALAQSPWVGASAAAAAVLIVLLLTSRLPYRTAAGARVFAELRGFQEFMNSVDADRMQRLTPDLFERYLPYAVALGVEHHWGAAFSTISAGPPLWLTTEERGSIADFMGRLGLFSQATRQATLRMPRGRSAAAAMLLPRLPNAAGVSGPAGPNASAGHP